MRQIIFHEETKTFHLYNEKISYILCVLENGHLGQLYFGKRLHDKADFSYLVEKCERPMTSYIYEWDRTFSLEHIRQEYPVYGTTDYRHPAIELLQENGSRISEFQYDSYEIIDGKPKLSGLPATYTESEGEAQTLRIFLKDALTGAKLALLYTIFDEYSAIARSAYIENAGEKNLHVLNMMSLSLDLPDKDYEWMQLSGAWSRERYIKNRTLEQGITAIDSMRGNSSHEHNPFLALKRHNTDENAGEAIGISLVYSGNFRMQAEVDTHNVTRITAGINPEGFDWKLEPGESFQTPEAVLVYSENGLNGMSQTFQKLYAKRLARGYWRDKARPILNNNWEATYFDFTEDRLVEIAGKAKECGVELFVLDDGWFGARRNDRAGLGDWVANEELLPNGIKGLSERIEALGLKFGLWFEPEMVNKDSDLYRAHPDWILQTPGRNTSHGRYQYVLDFARKEVVDYIYGMMTKLLSESKISYIKWDMNRSITECYSSKLPSDRQGEVFHRYILGVYDLYERLTNEFPEVLFESCASGGGRFDPGMLYYAPQGWTSDDSDAIERLKIQYDIYGMMTKLLSESKISYIKWDMNRSITECYSSKLPSDRQGEVFHRYILGVYDLYERLTNEFPEVLFESCASGGGRFDPGMLYYAPQGWTSDDSDAIERLKIQYGTSMCYPLSSMGSHVSVVPNHQVFRNTPLHTRANVAYFGTFGYELDLNKLTEEEIKEVKEQITFMKEYREVLQFGTFYRLKSPFEGNETVWMVTNEDRTLAIVGYYRVLNGVNQPYSRVRLQGLNPDMVYENVWNHTENYGDELMNYGLITSDVTAGEVPGNVTPCTDFESRIYMLKGKKVQEGR